MPTFEVGDIVKVPFSHIDTPRRQSRPALVVRYLEEPSVGGIVWAFMIPTAIDIAWAHDIPIVDMRGTGLSARSVIRAAKLSTVSAPLATRIGQADRFTLAAAMEFLVNGPRA